MTEINTEIFKIPEANIERLHAEIGKINKRADKIGAPRVELIDHGVEYVIDHVAVNRMVKLDHLTREDAEARAPRIKMHCVSINGAGPKIEGYTFVGSLDHYSLPNDVLIKTVPGESIPQSHYNASPVCDHCGKVRARKNTYVLRNDETGEHLQVGSQCIRDFIGYDPVTIARFLERVWNLVDDMNDQDDGFGGGGSGGPVYFDPIKILEITAATIRTFGWCSRARSEQDGNTATSAIVQMIIRPPVNARDRQERRELINRIEWDEQKDRKEAVEAIEWIKTKDDENEYITNLKKLANAESIPDSGFGMWVSLLAAYQREQERLNEKARQFKTNDWVGEVGKRQQFTAELVGVFVTSGRFGEVTIHRFVDDGGHTLVWFANTDSGMEKGHTYKIKGTIKKHDEYKGWKQTTLNRVKIEEDLGVLTK